MNLKKLFGITKDAEVNSPILQQLLLFIRNNAVNSVVKTLASNNKSKNPLAIPYTPGAIMADCSVIRQCSSENNLSDDELAALISSVLMKRPINSIPTILEQNGYIPIATDRISYLTTYCSTLHSLQEFSSIGVKKYEISTCGDQKVCSKCAKHNGKKHMVSKAVIGKNAPPFCEHCRCIIMADLGGLS